MVTVAEVASPATRGKLGLAKLLVLPRLLSAREVVWELERWSEGAKAAHRRLLSSGRGVPGVRSDGGFVDDIDRVPTSVALGERRRRSHRAVPAHAHDPLSRTATDERVLPARTPAKASQPLPKAPHHPSNLLVTLNPPVAASAHRARLAVLPDPRTRRRVGPAQDRAPGLLHVAKASEEALLLEPKVLELLLDRELLGDELLRAACALGDAVRAKVRELLHLELLLLLLRLHHEELLLLLLLSLLGGRVLLLPSGGGGTEAREVVVLAVPGAGGAETAGVAVVAGEGRVGEASHEIEARRGRRDQAFVHHVGDGAERVGLEASGVRVEGGRRGKRGRRGEGRGSR